MNKQRALCILCFSLLFGNTPHLYTKKEEKIKIKKIVKGSIKVLVSAWLISLALKKQMRMKIMGFNVYSEKSPKIRKISFGLLGGLIGYHGLYDVVEGFHI